MTIEVFLEHFKKLNNNTNESTSPGESPQPQTLNLENCDLDYLFTEDEVSKGLHSLKNGKASGIDLIVNEFIKHCPQEMVV